MNAIEKLQQRIQKMHSLVCVGLDSELEKIPTHLSAEQTPQFSFNKAIIDATRPYVCAFKPNITFYEARGEQGIKELKLTMEYLQENYPDIFTICDAKRADIGSTNSGYVKEIFDWFNFDAVTLHPYLGKEALMPFLERTDKVSIVLCRTSNPGAGELQDLKVGENGEPLWLHVAKQVSSEWNTASHCMLVVGATYPNEMKQIREAVGDMPFLVPGIGAQGGDLEQTLSAGLDSKGQGVLVNSSRGVIFASNGSDFAEKAAEKAKELHQQISDFRQKHFAS